MYACTTSLYYHFVSYNILHTVLHYIETLIVMDGVVYFIYRMFYVVSYTILIFIMYKCSTKFKNVFSQFSTSSRTINLILTSDVSIPIFIHIFY